MCNTPPEEGISVSFTRADLEALYQKREGARTRERILMHQLEIAKSKLTITRQDLEAGRGAGKILAAQLDAAWAEIAEANEKIDNMAKELERKSQFVDSYWRDWVKYGSRHTMQAENTRLKAELQEARTAIKTMKYG